MSELLKLVLLKNMDEKLNNYININLLLIDKIDNSINDTLEFKTIQMLYNEIENLKNKNDIYIDMQNEIYTKCNFCINNI
jgi:hypothetical protein